MIRWSFSQGGRRAAGAIAGALTIAAIGAAVSGCGCKRGPVVPMSPGEPALQAAPAPGRINHVVFFELEDPADADTLIAESLKLGEIPGVTACYAGRRLDTGRDTVRQDYDVGFFVAFDSEEAYASYVAHPDHVALVEKWGPRLRALRVYDVLDERSAN